MRLDCVGVYSVIDFSQVAFDIPAQMFPLLVFEPLKLFYEIKFETRGNPRGKLKGNVFMRESSP
jgi:hypothetical protein